MIILISGFRQGYEHTDAGDWRWGPEIHGMDVKISLGCGLGLRRGT